MSTFNDALTVKATIITDTKRVTSRFTEQSEKLKFQGGFLFPDNRVSGGDISFTFTPADTNFGADRNNLDFSDPNLQPLR